jgi:RNA polymerase sigma-70 factor (ECF subfamily)
MIKKAELGEILNQCKKNDRHAQKLVYDSYYCRYFTLCVRYLNCNELASESVNEMFLKAFSNLNKLNDLTLFEGWMKKICINECLNQIKKNKQHLFVDIEDSNHLFIDHDYNDAISNISMEELLLMVKQLPPQMRNVFNLYIIDGHKHNEISEMLSISTGTSKYHLHQARLQLQKAISVKDDYNKKQKLNGYG